MNPKFLYYLLLKIRNIWTLPQIWNRKSQIIFLQRKEYQYSHSVAGPMLGQSEFSSTNSLFSKGSLFPPLWNTELQEHFNFFQLFFICFVSNDCVRTGWHLAQPFLMGGQGLRDQSARLSHSYLSSRSLPRWTQNLGTHFPPTFKSLRALSKPHP